MRLVRILRVFQKLNGVPAFAGTTTNTAGTTTKPYAEIVRPGWTRRQALVRHLRQDVPIAPDGPIFRSRRGGPLGWRGIQQVFNRLKARAGIPGRCSPHTLRHTFARAYLVNGGDAFSQQRILGHTTLDMVKRYVALAEGDLVARHRAASPADRLMRS